MSTTSLHIFREHLRILPDGTIDASRIHSVECYQRWLESREVEDTDSEAKKFQRSLSNHLSGVDGRSCFLIEEEKAILAVLRVKQRWPCFPNRIVGMSGFRAKGYHEKNQSKQQETCDVDAPANPKPTRSKRAKVDKRKTTTSAAASASVSDESDYPPSFVPPLFQQQPPPPPPPPPQQQLQQHPYAHYPDEATRRLVCQLTSYVHSFPTFNAEVWKSILEVFRMMMLSRSPVCSISVPAMHAQQLCEAVTFHKGPDTFVLVIDFTAKKFEARFLAQNHYCVNMFGDMVGQFSGMLLQAQDCERYLFNAMCCLQNPGNEFELRQMQLVCLTGIVNMFDASLAVDPISYLFVFAGRLAVI